MTIDISHNGQPAKRYFNVSEQFASNLARYAAQRDLDTVITVVCPTSPEWL